MLKTYRRLAYVSEDDFYPRLDLDKLVAILNGSAAAEGVPRESAEPRDDELADDAEWLDCFRRNLQEEKARAAVRVRPVKAAPISPESVR